MGEFIWLEEERSLTSVSLVFVLLGVWRRSLPLLRLLFLLWWLLVLPWYPFSLCFHLLPPTNIIALWTNCIHNIKQPITALFVRQPKILEAPRHFQWHINVLARTLNRWRLSIHFVSRSVKSFGIRFRMPDVCRKNEMKNVINNHDILTIRRSDKRHKSLFDS